MDEPTAEDLFKAMVDRTCQAVCAYIGMEYGWELVAPITNNYRRAQQDHTVKAMRNAWASLPASSQQIVAAEAKRAGYSGRPTRRVLPLRWCTAKQRQARQENIVSIAMRAVAHEDWLKR